MVDVEMTDPNGITVTVLSLVDSGADVCIFNTRYAEVLGIDLAECERHVGLGVGHVPLEIFETELTLKPEGLPAITTTVMFVDSDGVDGLLGQEGFFDAHHIAFRRDRNEFEIVPTGEGEVDADRSFCDPTDSARDRQVAFV